MLEKLSEDEDWEVRRSVALNPNTSAETLEKLSGDKNIAIRYYVAGHLRTSVEMLAKLGEDKDWLVRQNVVYNKSSTLTAVLSILNRDTHLDSKIKSMTKRRISFIFGINKRPKYTISTRKYRNKFSKLNIWTDDMINDLRFVIMNSVLLLNK